MGELHSAHVKMYTKMYMICMYVLCRIVLFYCILWRAIKLIILIAWNVHKYYIDIVLWTFQDILHRIYPNKLSGSLWHSFLYTGVFAKGQIFHIRIFFIRNVEKILAEIWPKIYFQRYIDSSPPAQLDKKKMLQPNSKLSLFPLVLKSHEFYIYIIWLFFIFHNPIQKEYKKHCLFLNEVNISWK